MRKHFFLQHKHLVPCLLTRYGVRYHCICGLSAHCLVRIFQLIRFPIWDQKDIPPQPLVGISTTGVCTVIDCHTMLWFERKMIHVQRFTCFHIWSPVGGANLESYGNILRWSLTGGHGFLRLGLKVCNTTLLLSSLFLDSRHNVISCLAALQLS